MSSKYLEELMADFPKESAIKIEQQLKLLNDMTTEEIVHVENKLFVKISNNKSITNYYLGEIIYRDGAKSVLLKCADYIASHIYCLSTIKPIVDRYLEQLKETHYPPNWPIVLVYDDLSIVRDEITSHNDENDVRYGIRSEGLFEVKGKKVIGFFNKKTCKYYEVGSY